MLVNARHVKNMPGRNIDVSDAALLPQLVAHGLVRGAFVPPEPIRQLRDLTRTRTTIARERGREIQCLAKLAELAEVAAEITGVSGRAMLVTGTFHDDPGGSDDTGLDSNRPTNRAVHRLATLGYAVALDPLGVTG